MPGSHAPEGAPLGGPLPRRFCEQLQLSGQHDARVTCLGYGHSSAPSSAVRVRNALRDPKSIGRPPRHESWRPRPQPLRRGLGSCQCPYETSFGFVGEDNLIKESLILRAVCRCRLPSPPEKPAPSVKSGDWIHIRAATSPDNEPAAQRTDTDADAWGLLAKEQPNGRRSLACMAEYFIDVFDGTDWVLDPDGIALPSDGDVEKAAVAALRVLVEERFQESLPLDLIVRLNDQGFERSVRPERPGIHHRWINSPPQKERHQDDDG